MLVNVEFFDENPIENVITSLNYKVDKTLFFGYQHVLDKENRNRVEQFLKKQCGNREVRFYAVDDVNLPEIVDTISAHVKRETEAGNQVFFDLTGGESLPLVAFGILSRELKAPMHMYDIHTNKMHEYGYPGVPRLKEFAEHCPVSLDLDGYISLYGGTINYRMHKDFKDAWSQEEMDDVAAMWKLSRICGEKWVHYSALLRKFAPDSDLMVYADEKQVQAALKRNSAIGSAADLNEFLDSCEAAGFLRSVCHKNGVYRYTYKNQRIKNYFWDGGSILEMYVFLKEVQDDTFDDCRVGVHIDWDGVIHKGSGKDVLNEIDIMSIQQNVPTFISCKIGNVDQMALYELETVANRFGGKYAKKVLAVAKEVAPVYLLRAEEMGIEIRVMS
ncbi:MAG: DUF1887 family protein [Lachnospiraceae bacterium]|nr:DUF1887 family protein [Lachnospiraceae bacterium]